MRRSGVVAAGFTFDLAKGQMSQNARVTPRCVAGVCAAAAIALVAASAAAGPQRATPAEGRLAFEAATIKLAAPDAERNRVMQTSPNRLYIPSMTLTALIYAAYGDGGFNTSMRVTGGPDWIDKTFFAVEGVASGPATPRQLRLMLQTLLEERFALKIRNVTESVFNQTYRASGRVMAVGATAPAD